MEEFLALAKQIGTTAALIGLGSYFVIKELMRRERHCDQRHEESQRTHLNYVEQQTRTVTVALIDNTQSNKAVADATRELTQALTGKHKAI